MEADRADEEASAGILVAIEEVLQRRTSLAGAPDDDSGEGDVAAPAAGQVGILADLYIRTAVWVIAALTAASGLFVASRMY